jgi:hypothetical protein
MIDNRLALTACRTRLLGTTVATTGSTALSATASGYVRAAGSFLDDGFAVGHEITLATGFSGSANNQATTAQGRVVTGVTATVLTCAGNSTESAGSGKTVTVGIPFKREWDGVLLERASGFPYISDRWVPATHNIITFPAQSGQAEERGLYVVTWFGLSGKGTDAIRSGVDAIKARFTPGTTLTLSDGDVLRIRGSDAGPQAGQIIPIDGGWSYCQLTIPWIARSANVVV